MKNETSKIITLSLPIIRGDKKITDITVIKPTVPALKGLKMFDVLQMDVDSLQKLLPRVTQPVLHKADFDTMEVADFTELSAAAVGFLGKNSETEDPTE
ncbi:MULTISPECIES: phage tail assembly protein [Rodentibacter]|uniref:Phage tail assembly protein n=1 Tax=Rodentibacter pneumotropicus TaxID=758 RepID=A0A4S2P6H4_9PAST|nr:MULTISPECIES: phage tail assembly protein [Pasteurellaceae]TGY50816.1 phage tail assembly protein [Pasteurella caecimuris]TGZ98510.1 phage tail assembly protein [Rodentibacter pneumotropicus]THA00956.1 phage tail assembly protein [Rodentibacter pneumotropicus]THA08184.1 phage tail assembly protein [Rodentibacter pneumotropicus]THA09125.1 phage tail assembly protein [Rodentibacter pneumotropicus]